MAVPFYIPDEPSEVETIFRQMQEQFNTLYTIWRCQLLAQQQQSSSPSTSSSSRVRHTPSHSRARNGEVVAQSAQQAPIAQTVFPDLLTDLSFVNNRSFGSATISSVRSPQERATSQSSNHEETEISMTAIMKPDYNVNAQDWNKIDCTNYEKTDPLQEEEGILSKLMPTSVSSCSLMTAMICFVGWHIFRGR